MALEAMPHQVMTTPREAIHIPLIVTMTPMEARTVKMMPMEARMRINPTEARMRMTLMEERMRMTTMKARMTMNLTEARMTMNPTEARMIHLTASKAGTTWKIVTKKSKHLRNYMVVLSLWTAPTKMIEI
jgi:hypothetical protein